MVNTRLRYRFVPRDGDCPRDGDQSWDIEHLKNGDHPRDGDKLRDGDPSMEICGNLDYTMATLGLHLGFSAMLRIWQVPACKMEP